MSNVTELPQRQTDRITKDNFWHRATQFAADNPGDRPTIAPGTEEWSEWERYFQNHLRWEPWALVAARTGKIPAMTVPTQWPQWFDSSFSAA